MFSALTIFAIGGTLAISACRSAKRVRSSSVRVNLYGPKPPRAVFCCKIAPYW
jgi:hypothetical protein